MRSWYYMGRWVNVWNFRKKSFLKNFNTFFCFENDLSVIFGFLTPKFMKVPVFIKVQWTKLKIWTKMHYHQFQRRAPRGRKRRIVVQIFNCNISETIELEAWNLVLLLIFTVCTYAPNWNLRRWVSGMSHFDVDFPQG